MMSDTEDELALLLEVYYQGEYTVQLIKYRPGQTLWVEDLRKQLIQYYELTDDSPAWIVYKGRKLSDSDKVQDIGIFASHYHSLLMLNFYFRTR